jgi:putative ABC transport system ATP-binding protein
MFENPSSKRNKAEANSSKKGNLGARFEGGRGKADLEAIIRLRGLYKVYRLGEEKLRALDGVDLDIYPGEFLCIVGRSGSGKSTLLNMMAGLEKPTRGAVQIAGERLEKMSEAQLVRFRLEHVGFIFQQFNLFASMNALENVTMPLLYRGVPPKARKTMALEALKTLGLLSHKGHKPAQMSGGQQQRVGIARALVSRPEIVFADEPTGNLDSRTSDEILGIIQGAARESGSTLVMVTHDSSIAERADRVVRLLDGKVIEIIENKRDYEQKAEQNNGAEPKEELPA